MGLSERRRKVLPTELLGAAMDSQIDKLAVPWDARKGVEAELEEDPTLTLHLRLVSPLGWCQVDGMMIGWD